MSEDPYADAKGRGIYRQIQDHKYKDLNAAGIVERILKNKGLFEERQRKKSQKAIVEELVKAKEEEAAKKARAAAANGTTGQTEVGEEVERGRAPPAPEDAPPLRRELSRQETEHAWREVEKQYGI